MNRRKRYCIAVIAVVCLLMLLSTGCNKSVEYPPYYEAVSSVLGQNVETVVAKMGLTMDDFEFISDNCYWYDGTVEYLGYNFNMRLTTYTGEDAGIVQGIMYLLSYDAAPEDAANAAVDIRNKLKEGYGESYVASKYMTERPALETYVYNDFLAMFSEDDLSGETSSAAALKWILSKDVSAIPERIQDSKTPTCISLQLLVSYPVVDSMNAEGLGTAQISLSCGLTKDYRNDSE